MSNIRLEQEETDDQLLSFKLPEKHKPGTNVMSKLVLSDAEVTNIVTSTIVGPNARNQYIAVNTEWPNSTKSDVLYYPRSSENKVLDPILIEIQHTVDLKVIQRVIGYCLSINKAHSRMPTVIIFCVSSIKSEVRRNTTPSDNFPYLLKYACTGWANNCFLMDAKSIQNHTQKPLIPFVAMGLFFTKQKLSLSNMEERDDETIQLLYRVAKSFFEDDDIQQIYNQTHDLQQLCDQIHTQFNEALQALEQDVPDENTRKRTAQFLQDGLTYVAPYKKKYSIQKQNTNDPAVSQSEQSTSGNDSTVQDVSPQLPEPNVNWTYVEDYRAELGENTMDWEKCYLEGKENGFFKNYNNWRSVKSGYYRFLKKKN